MRHWEPSPVDDFWAGAVDHQFFHPFRQGYPDPGVGGRVGFQGQGPAIPFPGKGFYLGAGVQVAAAPQHIGLGLGLDLGQAEGLVGLQIQVAGADFKLRVEPLARG